MRILLPAVLFCWLGSVAVASPWDEFLARRQGRDPRLARWTLCMRSGELPSPDALADEILYKLRLGNDVVLEPLGGAEAKDLWTQQSWGEEPHWVLLSPAGALVTTQAGQPKGQAVLDAIHGAGGKARWEVRTAFLQDHPEQGEARLEALGQAFLLARGKLLAMDKQGKVQVPTWHPQPGVPVALGLGRVSLPRDVEGAALAEELYADAAKALQVFFKLPGWPREVPTVSTQLMLWDLSQSSSMRRVFSQAADEAGQLLRQDPYSYDLANFWMEAKEAAGLAPEPLGGAFAAVPGRVWPTPAILNRLGEPYRRRQDWDGLLNYLDDLWPQAPPAPLSAGAWQEYCKLRSAAKVQEAIALASQGAWDRAAAALEEARELGGGQGVREALVLRGGQWAGAAADQASWRGLLNQVLAKGGPKPPGPAQEPPLRLVVLGSPKWIVAWSRLPQAPELLLWSPGELRWEAGSRELHQELQARFQWDSAPRWALLRGEELKATGLDCPRPEALASVLESQGPALLQRFQTLLAEQPDHRAARQARCAQLLTRMPEPRLEALLAQDAAAVRLPLPFDPTAAWKPDPDIWAVAAQQVLPKVEEELRSWPSRSALWNTWISWARFHPGQPSILALAQSLPYWSPQGDWRTGLPYQVQRAVAAELRRQGSFDAMRLWFRAAWETLDHRPLAALRNGERAWVQQRRREEETAIFQPLRDALQALRCTHEQVELERVFAAMVGREGRRP